MVAAPSSAETEPGWSAKNAYRRCEGAIGGRVSWPSDPEEACRAMHLCANEARFNVEQYRSLMAEIHRVPDCEEP